MIAPGYLLPSSEYCDDDSEPSPRTSFDGHPSPMDGGDDVRTRARALGQLASDQLGLVSLTPARDTSGELDPSPRAAEDVSRGEDLDLSRRCRWCRGPIPPTLRPDSQFCSKACRQAAWRARRVELCEHAGQSLVIAYADPPYPGTARRYYADQPNYRGEVDHARLLSLLEHFDGWALSTSQRALRWLLPLCPEDVRTSPWCKPIGVSRRTRGPHNAFEVVIYRPARLVAPGVRDWLLAKPARHGGDLPGRKPIAFVRWVFSLLGMAPGDALVDLFPGSGIVSRAWAQCSGRPSGDIAPNLPITSGRLDSGGHG